MPHSNDLAIAFKLLFGKKNRFDLPVMLSIIGMSIGVACLLTAMAVISGYETTLKKTVTNFVGHIVVVNKENESEQQKVTRANIEKAFPEITASTPFSMVDAAIVHNKKLNGVILNGVDEKSFAAVLKLENHMVSGNVNFEEDSSGRAQAVIGKELAKKFGLKPGDVFRLVLPASSEGDVSKLRPKVASLSVSGIVNIGRYDFDSRYIFMGIKPLQEFAMIGDRVTGFRMVIEDDTKAENVAFNMNKEFGDVIRARSWVDVNYSLFEAAKIEKTIIFFVLLIIVFAAAANVTSSLYIMVFKRYPDIAILKTLGYSEKRIKKLFAAQGLMIGAIGVVIGVLLGVALCEILVWAQMKYSFVSGEVYKLDHIDIEIRFFDLVLVVLSSIFICFLATLIPASRASRLAPTEGLRYE